MNTSTKQKLTYRHRDQTCGCQRGGGEGEGQTGIWNEQMQTIMYMMDKQQGPTV